MTFLWIIAIVLSIVFVLLLVMVWLRKINFDAIHKNFLRLEDQYGGRVIRGGFAVRPRYAGTYEGNEFSIAITTEKANGQRLYYVAVNMQCKSKMAFSILATKSLENISIDDERQSRMKSIFEGQYLLEVNRKDQMNWLKVGKIEKSLQQLAPFGYILVGRSSIILERATENIFEGTKIDIITPILAGLVQLNEATR